MICEVAVFGFTLRPDTYTYLVPDELTVAPGQLVEIPFGKRKRDGVVVAVSATSVSPFELKPISSIKSPNLLLTPDQLKLASWIAGNYFISTAAAIQLLLPILPTTLTKLDQSIKKPVKQELVLFPTLKQAEQARLELKRGVIYSPTLDKKAFAEIWEGIRSGKTGLIIGTRSAVFAPFANLTKITIFQTESDLYKDERRPYYRCLQVAEALASISGANLEAISYSPRVQDQFTITHTIRKIKKYHQTVTDLRHYKIINDSLETFLNSPGKTLVFLNRKSEKGALICRTCKSRSWTDDPSVCPNCGSADVKFELFNLRVVQKKLSVSPQIVFATQQIFFQNQDDFDQIAVLSADTYLTQGHYNSSEKTFSLLTNLLRLLKPGGTILVQSAYPSDPGIKFGLANDYASFYQQALTERQESSYPPFTKLAKLTFTGKDVIPEINLPEELALYGPFAAKNPYYIVKGLNLAPLKEFYRPWKLDIDPLSL